MRGKRSLYLRPQHRLRCLDLALIFALPRHLHCLVVSRLPCTRWRDSLHCIDAFSKPLLHSIGKSISLLPYPLSLSPSPPPAFPLPSPLFARSHHSPDQALAPADEQDVQLVQIDPHKKQGCETRQARSTCIRIWLRLLVRSPSSFFFGVYPHVFPCSRVVHALEYCCHLAFSPQFERMCACT